MRRLFRFELPVLTRFVLAALEIVLIWLLVFGWRTSQSFGSGDATSFELLLARELGLSGGDPALFRYRPGLLGGTPLLPVMGMPWPHRLGAWLGLSPLSCLNATALLCQSLAAFFGIELLLSLQKKWGALRFRLSPPLFISCVALFGFAPLFGWRMAYGHWQLVLGSLLLASLLAVAMAQLAGRLSATLLLLSALNAMCVAASPLQQQPVYIAYFGIPLVLALIGEAGALRALATAVLPLLAGYALSAPTFLAILSHVRSPEFFRTTTDAALVYSFGALDASDLASSLTWGTAFLPPDRSRVELVETNLALGPLLLLLLLLPWRRAGKLVAGLSLGIAGAILFSVHTPGISDFLIEHLPLLKAFRNPGRALLPLHFTLIVVAVSGAVFRWPDGLAYARPRWRPLTAAVGLALLPWLLPEPYREAASWVLVAALVAGVLLRSRALPLARRQAAVLLILALVASGSVRAFHTRFAAPLPEVSQRLKAHAPASASPLDRLWVDFEDSEFAANTGALYGIPTIQGRGFPPARALKLLRALLQSDVPVVVDIELRSQRAREIRPLLEALYNVRGTMTRNGSGVHVTPSMVRSEAAWFSARVTAVESFEELASRLRADFAKKGEAIRNELFLVKTDPAASVASVAPAQGAQTAVPAPVPVPVQTAMPKECLAARVTDVTVSELGQRIDLRVHAPERCPLTVAMNFSGHLRASAVLADGAKVAVPLLPGYGSLTSLWVPRGTERVRIEASDPVPPYAAGVQVVGLLLLAIALRIRQVHATVEP
ncbi:MAG: hypothetical protein NDJ90_03655 [Oligoflexia bacterium]|nr:hypothetical protein [Oligoflexia bacterium]